jgi:glutamate transport system substrate-binding protein
MISLRGALTALAVLGCLILSACGGAAAEPDLDTFPEGSTMARIQQRGGLSVGITFDEPMFGFKEPASGLITGFDAEIARLVARDLTGDKRNIRFVETRPSNREEYLQRGVVDIVVATYSITPERAKSVAFTDPYYIAGQDILVRVGTTNIQEVAHLSGKTVCSATGTTSVDRLRARVPEAKIREVGAFSECMTALKAGIIDAISTDDTVLLGLLSRHPHAVRLVGRPFGREPYGIGVPKGDTDLRDHLNTLIKRYLGNGEWDRAFRETIGTLGVDPELVRPPATAEN